MYAPEEATSPWDVIQGLPVGRNAIFMMASFDSGTRCVVARVDCDGPFEGPLETRQDRLFDYSFSDTEHYPGLRCVEKPSLIVVLWLSLATVPHRRGSIPAEPALQGLY